MRFALTIAAFVAAFTATALGRAAEQGDAAKKSADAAKGASGGPDSTTETFGDWSIVCSAQGGSAERACEVDTSVLLRGQSAPFARIAVVRPSKDKPAQIVALVPVNVSLGSPIRITGESGKLDLDLSFRSCVPGGCLADVELSKDQSQVLAGPAKASGQLILVDASGKTATLPISLRGLDQALGAYFRQQDK